MEEKVEDAKAVEVPKLREVITGMLADAGCTKPDFWEAGLHPDADHVHPKIQMLQCSRQWNLILAPMPADTRFRRYCLNDAGTVKNWLTSFEVGVIPLLLNGGQEPVKPAPVEEPLAS